MLAAPHDIPAPSRSAQIVRVPANPNRIASKGQILAILMRCLFLTPVSRDTDTVQEKFSYSAILAELISPSFWRGIGSGVA